MKTPKERAPPPCEKVARRERRVPRSRGGADRQAAERPSRRTHGHAKRHAGVGQRVDHRKAPLHLPPERVADDGRGQAKVVDEHLSVEALRRHRAEQRSPQHVLVRGAPLAQDLSERRARAVDLHRGHEAVRQVHAMRSPLIGPEFEHSRNGAAMEDPQEIAQRRRAQAASQLHGTAMVAPARGLRTSSLRSVARLFPRASPRTARVSSPGPRSHAP